jgi:hypothetical protein|tara:strand:+ start:606 stop:1085 length:480 start_codon:yes stop_codon:yes gene_type:complete
MNDEPRMTLAGQSHGSEEAAATVQASTRTVTPPPIPTKVEALQGGVVALIGLVTDIQDRLAKLEGSDSRWVETMQATILSEAEQAVETACKDVDWENLAEQAVQNTDCGYIIESGVESAVDQIEWEDHASEAVEEAVRDLDIGELVAERLAKVRIGIIN